MIRLAALAYCSAALAAWGPAALRAQRAAPAADSARAASPGAADSAAGTYELWVCRDARTTAQPCDAAAAVVAGYLVLNSGPIALEAIADTGARRHLEISYMFVAFGRASAPANGCYALAPSAGPGPAPTYAGLGRAGLTRWRSRADGALEFGLYRSPDAGYDVVAIARGGALAGEGHSWGFGYEDSPGRRGPAEAVAGRRLGPPDPARCAEAAAAEARRRRSR